MEGKGLNVDGCSYECCCCSLDARPRMAAEEEDSAEGAPVGGVGKGLVEKVVERKIKSIDRDLDFCISAACH